MNYPETFQTTQVETVPPLRERFLGYLHGRYEDMHGQGDEGIGTAIAVKLGALVLTSGVLTVAAYLNTSVETSNTLSSKGGTITAIYTMPAKECHGGVDAIINAKSEVNVKLAVPGTGIKIPTTNRASEEFNSGMTAEVCNTSVAQGAKIIDLKTHHVTIKIGAEDLTTTVYPKDPTDPKAWTSDVGIFKALQKNFGNVVKATPGGLDYKGGDEVTSKLRGQALLVASDVMSRKCGNVAWQKLSGPYGEEIKKEVVAENNSAVGATKISEADVTVELPQQVNMDNQYSDLYAAMQKAAKGKYVKFTEVNPNVVCRDNGVQVTDNTGTKVG